MVRKSIYITLFFSFSLIRGHAQDSIGSNKGNIIKIGMLHYRQYLPLISFETVIFKKTSLNLSGGFYWNYDLFHTDKNSFSNSRETIALVGLRRYLFFAKYQMQGLYAEFSFFYFHEMLRRKDLSSKDTNFNYMGGLGVGFQWMFHKRWVANIQENFYLGIQDFDHSSWGEPIYHRGGMVVGITSIISIGYKF